jgi:alpha-1,3-rhamnosyl/mannosyltransferase
MNEMQAARGNEPEATGSADLRVAVNAMCLWRPLTGIGQYTLNIARQWEASGRFQTQYFYGSDWNPHAAPRVASGLSLVKRLVKKVVPRPYEISRALLQRGFDQRPGRFDVYFEPNFLPFRFDCPTVLTVHDLSYVRYPETHPSDRVRIMAKLLPPAIERAAHILTDSQFQRAEIIEYFGTAADRVTACYLGVAEEFRPRRESECGEILTRHGLQYRQYLLAVSTVEPRKNLKMVLDAYSQLPVTVRDRCPLVIAGMRGWNIETLGPRLRALAQSGAIRLLGFVDETELPSIYSGARMFLYPSLYEGFGLPVVEAMASGVPVIVSNRSSLPEIVADAGVQVAPEDVEAMTLAIRQLHEDPLLWERRSGAGIERARRFTWAVCAEKTANALVRAAQAGAGRRAGAP